VADSSVGGPGVGLQIVPMFDRQRLIDELFTKRVSFGTLAPSWVSG
jgi:hypothetical protein